MKFIRLPHSMGNDDVYEDVNVSKIESVLYFGSTNETKFVVGKRTITVSGDWSETFYKFIASGAVWTDGRRYEYAR